MKSAISFVMALGALYLVASECHAQLMCEPTKDPAEVEFIYDDLEHFIIALDKLGHETDSAAVIQKTYIENASAGLREYIGEKNVTAEDYLDLIRKKPVHYLSLLGFPEFLEAHENDVRASLSKMQSIIPGSVFLPVYYLVGFYGGLSAEPSPYGLLLAFGNPDREPDALTSTVVHETVHVQQALTVGMEEYFSIFGPKKSLLAFTLREGVAVFLTDMITDQQSHREALEYYLEHEDELIARFKREMNDSSAGDWMWKKPKNPDQPPHIGYVLGSMIVKAYYDNAGDKSQAVLDILAITDYPAFYEKSGYGK